MGVSVGGIDPTLALIAQGGSALAERMREFASAQAAAEAALQKLKTAYATDEALKAAQADREAAAKIRREADDYAIAARLDADAIVKEAQHVKRAAERDAHDAREAAKAEIEAQRIAAHVECQRKLDYYKNEVDEAIKIRAEAETALVEARQQQAEADTHLTEAKKARKAMDDRMKEMRALLEK